MMCACYLIYYYDMEAWDAIRIMRRQRPGSVERKVRDKDFKSYQRYIVGIPGSRGYSGKILHAVGRLWQGQHRQARPEREAAHGDEEAATGGAY